MSRWIIRLLLWSMMLAIVGCTPDKQRGVEDVGGPTNKVKFDAYGINVGDDNAGRERGPLTMIQQVKREQRQPQLIQSLEQRIRRLKGVADAQIIGYHDNLIVGIATDIRVRPDVINTADDSRETPLRPDPYGKGTSDGIQHLVAGQLRTKLQAQTTYNMLHVTSDPILYRRIVELKQMMRTNQVHDDEFRVLLNEIGYQVKPYNLVD